MSHVLGYGAHPRPAAAGVTITTGGESDYTSGTSVTVSLGQTFTSGYLVAAIAADEGNYNNLNCKANSSGGTSLTSKLGKSGDGAGASAYRIWQAAVSDLGGSVSSLYFDGYDSNQETVIGWVHIETSGTFADLDTQWKEENSASSPTITTSPAATADNAGSIAVIALDAACNEAWTDFDESSGWVELASLDGVGGQAGCVCWREVGAMSSETVTFNPSLDGNAECEEGIYLFDME